MLVGGVVVDDRMDGLSLGDLRVDLTEEADELLMPMTLHVAADDGAVQNVERGEQCGRADHFPEFLGELRIVRQFERPDTVRRELVGLEDTLTTRPLGGLSRRWLGHEVDDLLNRGSGKRRLAGPACLVAQQPVDAIGHEPRLPSPDHRLGFARPAHDLGGAATVGGGKDDLRAPHMLLRRTAIRHDRLKATAICSRDVDDNSCSHDESLNRFGRFGNRPNESDH